MCELLDFLALVTMCTAAIYFGLVGPIWAGLAASGRIGITEMHVLVALHNIWLGCVLILLSELVRCVERSSRIDDNNNNREPVVRNIGGNNGIGNDDDDGDYNE